MLGPSRTLSWFQARAKQQLYSYDCCNLLKAVLGQIVPGKLNKPQFIHLDWYQCLSLAIYVFACLFIYIFSEAGDKICPGLGLSCGYLEFVWVFCIFLWGTWLLLDTVSKIRASQFSKHTLIKKLNTDSTDRWNKWNTDSGGGKVRGRGTNVIITLRMFINKWKQWDYQKTTMDMIS